MNVILSLFLIVNTMIGTGGHTGIRNSDDHTKDPAQVIPAVLVPHGMNFWTPQTAATELKGRSPYYYGDSLIQGFRASHWIVGSMTQDYGSVTIMPEFGNLVTDPVARASKFSHAEELSTPYYYRVMLERYGILAEMTATSRTALFRFTFSQDGEGFLCVQPNSDEKQGRVQYDKETRTITGSNPVHRIYQSKGEYAGFDGHFFVEIKDKEIKACGADSVAWFKFDVKAGDCVLVRMATSFTSIDGARRNLAAECPDWDFEKMKSNLENEWKKTLSVIDIETEDPEIATSFYSALYHTSFLPHAFNDADGNYPSFGGGKSIEHTEGTYYEDYSLWDTYRALHPLKCLLDPQKAGEMVQSMLEKYKQGGWLPIFPCWNSYTSEMIGDHCASLVADAYFKGIRNFELDTAYEALYKNAFSLPETHEEYAEGKGRRALNSYMQYGYIPLQDPVKEAYHKKEQTSRTMEYAYDDYVFGLYAAALGHDSVASLLLVRSQNYRNVINPVTGWADGRNEDGSFLNSDPWLFQDFICEGAPCHYTWYVPHDIPGLMSLVGGEDIFIAKLDSLFDTGQYWHGNEPCHQVAYLYNYTSQPWKTAKRVMDIMKKEYRPTPDGLCGNDDAGQMSAWYIFSALGFYPICPGVPEYSIGRPIVSRATIHLPNGNNLVILAPPYSENENCLTVYLNGKVLERPFISHDEIMNGGILEWKR